MHAGMSALDSLAGCIASDCVSSILSVSGLKLQLIVKMERFSLFSTKTRFRGRHLWLYLDSSPMSTFLLYWPQD